MVKLDDGNIAIGVRLDSPSEDEIKVYKVNKDNAECMVTIEDSREIQMQALSGKRFALGYANCFIIYDFSKEYTNKEAKRINYDNFREITICFTFAQKILFLEKQ